MSNNNIKSEKICRHNNYEVIKITDQRFGDWKYGLFCNGSLEEWSWDCNALIQKAYGR